jgi:hypothetical protein
MEHSRTPQDMLTLTLSREDWFMILRSLGIRNETPELNEIHRGIISAISDIMAPEDAAT